MNKKSILILLFILTIAIGFSISTVSAAQKTIHIKNKDWETEWNTEEKNISEKYVMKEYGSVHVGIFLDYQRGNKKWAMKNMPKKYFESFVIMVESKKKFKTGVFYLYDDKTGKYKKKLTLKSRYMYLESLGGPREKAYTIYREYFLNHRYTCKKVVINY
ncbi:MAG: hypothetical protein LBU74_08105 [Methanobacteriaceae archaeon]|jgi:hypothetical protein|nr:hypothetical protein [Candidatus Methanorudis spinitermitis]